MKKALFRLLTSVFVLITISADIQAQATSSVAPSVKQTVKPTVKPIAKQAPAVSKATIQELPPSNDHSLDGQYQDLLKRSWTQQGYKVINPSRLDALWRSVQDSLRTERKKSPSLQAKINEQADSIRELKTKIEASQQNLEKSTAAVNEVSLMGVAVDKSTYSTIMWGAVITLAAALLIVVFTAGRSIREAKYRRQLYDEISAEYQAYKVKANDKEKKLARELQTERNRVEELLDKNK